MVRLIANGNPFLANGQGEVIQETAVSTNNSGEWSADLTPQLSLEAGNGTYYEADERDGLRDGKVWRFQVPTSGGPYWLRNVLIDGPPPSAPVPPVTAHVHAIADVTTLTARLDALELLSRRPQPSDRERYGDMLSTVERRQATANDEYTTAFATFSGVVSPAGFSATKIRFMMQTAAVGGTAAFVAVYTGNNPANLTRRARYNNVNAFTVLGLRELTLDATVDIAVGDYVYVLFGSAGYSTSPRLHTTVGAPAALINASIRYEGYGVSDGAAPATLDATDSAWTSTNTTPWWALVP
jgi:hypothetical protein